MGTQGFSPRTRSDAQLIRFGERAGRVNVRGTRAGVPLELEVTLASGEGKHARLNGATLRSAEQLRAEAATLVFTPDRLGVVKGGPAVRRAYFDRVAGRLAPARAGLSAEYGAAVGQRNAALRRIAAGFSGRDALEPWTARVVELGAELVTARQDALALLRLPFADHADGLGLTEADLRYDGEPPTREALDARVDADLARGATGLGPHLDDIVLSAGARELRTYGSQGEQRLALLALLLAEADLLADRRGTAPLLLLDDVLSELDPTRRRALADRVARAGQAVVTATDAAMLPGEPDQLLDVSPGEVHDRTPR